MSKETGDRPQAAGNRRLLLEKGSDIAERLARLGLAAIRLASGLPKVPAARHVSAQLVRCATGAGANHEEARAAECRADGVHKVGIAAKEMRETCDWMSLSQDADWIKDDIGPLVEEARQLAAILGASARTARANAASK